ncbi:MAG: hypothetical protein Q4A43_01575 [Coriobacteriia bacterium]|nr:hypothetical protein [Coriobacteriia bacterium]
MKGNMRRQIADEFKRMTIEKSLSKVRIAELIDKLGINRNTFYYYYGSKLDVAYWIFRWELNRALEHELPSGLLVYSDCELKDGSIERLAYWTHEETGARTLDKTKFFNALMHCLSRDIPFYRKVFTPGETEFTDWLCGLWSAAAKKDIDFILSGRPMNETVREYLARSYASQIIVQTMTCLQPEFREVLEEPEKYAYWNSTFEGIRASIERNPSGLEKNNLADFYRWSPPYR